MFGKSDPFYTISKRREGTTDWMPCFTSGKSAGLLGHRGELDSVWSARSFVTLFDLKIWCGWFMKSIISSPKLRASSDTAHLLGLPEYIDNNLNPKWRLQSMKAQTLGMTSEHRCVTLMW